MMAEVRENQKISADLIKAIELEKTNCSSEPNEELKKVLEEIMGCAIKIKTCDSDADAIIIEPYWCELYFNLGNCLSDPFCDESENKKSSNLLYFKSASHRGGVFNKRNRVDICLGDGDNEVSLLIKRAILKDGSGKDLPLTVAKRKEKRSGQTFSSDAHIAHAILEKFGNKKIEYEFISRSSSSGTFDFSQRIRLKAKSSDHQKWIYKKYAIYDSGEFARSESDRIIQGKKNKRTCD